MVRGLPLFLRCCLAVVVVSSVGLASAGPASARPASAGAAANSARHQTAKAVRATGAEELWTPTEVPFPASLPSGYPAASMDLESTSCSSASFCVAVGIVIDVANGIFPVAATYSDGSWTSALVPLPANAPTDWWQASLQSVSCPVDGTCAAVGSYLSATVVPHQDVQQGLLEYLTGGVWTPSEAPLPSGLGPHDANVNAVSCSDADTCTAIGWVSDGTTQPLVFTWSAGTWQFETLPAPTDALNYDNGLQLTSVSCPDDNDCVAVGGYENADDASEGLILTLSDDVWTATTAPLPANAVPIGAGARVLESVDCPESDYCVAGGYYQIAPMSTAGGSGVEAFLLTEQSGTWTAEQAPLPADADVTDLQSFVNGVDCPAVNACLAAGVYNFNYADQSEEGMLLTQASDGSWTAATAPMPGTVLPEGNHRRSGRVSGAAGIRLSDAAIDLRAEPADATTDATADTMGSSLSAVSCDTEGFCTAGGSDGSAGLVESEQIPSLPSVDAVAPSSGPVQGGTAVTISGANFTPTTTVDFGSTAAQSVTYVSPSEIQAVAPVVPWGGEVAVNVTTGGLTSGANVAALFTYQGGFTVLTTSLVPWAKGSAYDVHLAAIGATGPYRWTIVGGKLPKGMKLSARGVLTGKAAAKTKAGSYSFVVQATDSGAKPHLTARQLLTLSISA